MTTDPITYEDLAYWRAQIEASPHAGPTPTARLIARLDAAEARAVPDDDFDADGWNGFDSAPHAAAASIKVWSRIDIDGDDLRYALLHAGLRLIPDGSTDD
jgi:hypothetical protein